MNALQAHDAEWLESAEWLVGVDEAGRGCLAGPVVAGACVLARDFFEHADALARSACINDSKQLTATAREGQYVHLEALRAEGLIDFAVAAGSVAEIADLNILGANRLAMQRAVEALAGRCRDWTLPAMGTDDPLFAAHAQVRVLVDGRPLKPWPYAHEGLVKGDAKSLAIAMASIAAKVTRDRMMLELAERYPDYGFEQHKGYGTRQHRAALEAHGPCPAHRALFLRKVLGAGAESREV